VTRAGPSRTVCVWTGVAIAAVVALVMGSEPAHAQTVTAQTARGPQYIGEPVPIQVVAEGFEEDPAPTIEAPAPGSAGWRLAYRGVSPSVSSSVMIVGGQIRRSKEVKFVFSYELQVDRPGGVTVGPFVVSQGSVRKATRPLSIDFRDVPRSDRIGVKLEFPDTPVYVGERIPITVRFQLAGSVRENMTGYTLRVPLFDETDTFRFLDVPDAGSTDVKIQTAEGELDLKGDAQTTTISGEEALVVSIRRIAVPLREGPLSIPPTTLDVEEGTRFRRDLFGSRQATHVRKWRATDQPRDFVVKRIPADRTPPSFAGAVGSGFSLRVTADRTVVQVGEPIALTIELRGDGNLESASLPPLDARGLLPRSQFRVPEGELAGELTDGAKKFTAMVRVTDGKVTEIPALEYSWFDPASESFQMTQSRPIALSVRDAQVIGAAQVERDSSAEVGDGVTVPKEGAAAASTTASPLVLTGADLAIERDPARLLRTTSSGGVGTWRIAGVYVATLLLVGFAGFDRRRRDVDPVVAQRRRNVDEQLDRIRAAQSLPSAEAAGVLAAALRALIAEVPQASLPEIDSFVGECDARSYAPPAQRSAAALDPEFQQRALRLAQQISEAAR